MVLGKGEIVALSAEPAPDEPELAMLAVVAHSDDPGLRQAAEAALQRLRQVPADRAKVYYNVILAIARQACVTDPGE